MTTTRGDRVDSVDLPASRRDLVDRPRLMAELAGRFDRPVTLIVAGAGFGKTSLISQAVHHPAKQGHDLYVRIDQGEVSPDAIVRRLLQQIDPAVPSASGDGLAPGLLDALWNESPLHVSIVLDDVHRLDDDSAVWALLAAVLEGLPANAHLVLSGRRRPPMRLARLIATGDAAQLGEADLAFTSDELAAFAEMRGTTPDRLADHGWPAMVELEAHSGQTGAEQFAAEEIIADIDDARLVAIRRLSLAADIDDDMVAGATAYGGSARELLAGIPMVVSADNGALRMHDLWRELFSQHLSDVERRSSLVALADVWRERGDLVAAHAASVRAGDDEGVRRVLRELVRDYEAHHPPAIREEILATTPAHLATCHEAVIVGYDVTAANDPTSRRERLETAVDAAVAEGDSEMAALGLLRVGEAAFRSADLDGLDRIRRIATTLQESEHGATDVGAPEVVGALLEGWWLMLHNSSAKALDIIPWDDLVAYRPFAGLVNNYRAVQLAWSGQDTAALDEIERLRELPGGRTLQRLGGLVSILRWHRGELDAAGRAEIKDLVDRIERANQIHLFVEGASTTSLYFSSAGDVESAHQLVERGAVYRRRMPEGSWGAVVSELAQAVLELMSGAEQLAAARLNEVLPSTGPFLGFGRHVFGNVGSLLYLLVPRSRVFFDEEEMGPGLGFATTVGRAMVELREGNVAPAAALPWDDLERIRSWAYEPHLAELAIAASLGGNRLAEAALESLRHDPRSAIRAISERPGPIGRAAAERLASTPPRPAAQLRVAVLGPLQVDIGGRSLGDHPSFRRRMVRQLLAVLVHRRRISRMEAMTLLWPDKDEGAAGANLRTTLRHLRLMIEPRLDDEDAPPWYVRSDDRYLELFDNEMLSTDVDDFVEAIDAGRAADAQRRTGEALTHLRRAVDLVRGDYLCEVVDLDWAEATRIRFHLDGVSAAVRCSELLTVSGDATEAVGYALRGVDAEPLDERAHRALVRALIAADDRAGAHRALERAIVEIRGAGLEPEPQTIDLAATIESRRR